MLRTKLIWVCAAIFGLTSALYADFPAEEVWRVELDATATVLGSYWQDEDGQTFFLVGTANHVLIISEGEVVWESPELDGWVSALNRIDFGVGEGSEIVAATVEDSTGTLHRFFDDDYEEHNSFLIYVFEAVVHRADDPRHITSIDFFPEMLPDSACRVYLGNKHHLYGYDFMLNPYRRLTGGIRVFSLSKEDFVAEISTTAVIDSKVIDTDGNGQSELIIGRFSSYFSHIGVDYYELSYGITVFNSELEIQNSVRIFSYFNWSPPENNTGFFCLQLIVEEDDDNPALYVTYRDTGGSYVERLTIPNLERGEQIELSNGQRQINETPVYFYPNGENAHHYLLCINDIGFIYVIDVEDFRLVETFRFMEEFHFGSSVGNYDNDEELELAYLTSDDFYLFDIGPLSVPSGSLLPYVPERYAITAAYPNPFNAFTRIEYALPRPGRFAIGVYDLTGREVNRLSDGFMAAGSYHIVWNASEMPGGVYLVRLKGSGGDAARAVHLVK